MGTHTIAVSYAHTFSTISVSTPTPNTHSLSHTLSWPLPLFCLCPPVQAVRDQIRKMVVGGPLVAEDKSRGIDAVSDSEDDNDAELEAMEDDVGR